MTKLCFYTGKEFIYYLSVLTEDVHVVYKSLLGFLKGQCKFI